MICNEDVHVVEINLPNRVKGYTMALLDGTFCVVLNSNLSFEQRLETYNHELKHISYGDFGNGNNNIDALEINAHKE
jgi:hypothetical protein|nr:MAG TPA: IrrE N-terminal-like domain [Caudoviricetes sp.]